MEKGYHGLVLIKDFSPFRGQHCETTAVGSLLLHLGVPLSEPMLFGLGEGLGFIYWDMKRMTFPFLGGRIKPGLLTQHLARNLGIQYQVQETSSMKQAWFNIKALLDRGIPVGLQLDSYHLDYFTRKIHFAGHFVAMYGYDDTHAYLVDTQQQGGAVATRLSQLALARNEKGPMASRNLSYILVKQEDHAHLPLRTALVGALRRNAQEFLNPPIQNIGYRGIQKTSVHIKTWFQRSQHIKADLQHVALLMERGGTGGALFRNIYRDFLKESLNIIEDKNLSKGYRLFCEIAPMWTDVARKIHEAGETENQALLEETSVILSELAIREKEAMEFLNQVAD